MLSDIHSFVAFTILVVGAVTLICGITLLVLRRGVPDAETPPGQAAALVKRIFRWLLIATVSLGGLQAVLGGLLFLSGDRPGDMLHLVYGGLVLLAIPVLYVYSDQKRTRRDIIYMVIAVVLVIGAAVRAFMTGAPK